MIINHTSWNWKALAYCGENSGSKEGRLNVIPVGFHFWIKHGHSLRSDFFYYFIVSFQRQRESVV